MAYLQDTLNMLFTEIGVGLLSNSLYHNLYHAPLKKAEVMFRCISNHLPGQPALDLNS